MPTTGEATSASKTSAACYGCGRATVKLKRCSRCHAVCYCNVACQQHDWPLHKTKCNRLAATHEAARAQRSGFDEWLHRRGPDVTITDENLKDYIPNVEYKEPAKTVVARHTEIMPEYPTLTSYSLMQLGPNDQVAHWGEEAIAAQKHDLGRSYQKMSWQQTTTTALVKILLPSPTTSKQLRLELTPQHLFVSHAESGVICSFDFSNKVYVGGNSDIRGSSWQLLHNRCLELYLEKWDCRHVDACSDASQTFWRRVFVDSKEEDISARYPPSVLSVCLDIACSHNSRF
eukprot:m.33584 g.33584  ORF g.33584 m.33584 type:complete len:288 (-) comp12242_c0_seq3:179-1042(-)